MNSIRKVRSKNYKQIIEVNIPARFYWGDNGYDGFEFGSLENCSRHELRLLDIVIDQLFNDTNNSRLVEYLKEHHKNKLNDIINMINAEELNVPKEFLDAFGESQID